MNTGTIRDLFGTHKPIISFEFFPARTPEAAARLLKTVQRLKRSAPAFVSVTYGAGGSTRHLTVELVERIQNDIGLLSMAHLTCVGHDAEAIDQTLARLSECGIRNILALRGDPPGHSGPFPVTPGGFSHASELVQFIRSKYNFCIGGAAYPEVHPESSSAHADLVNLKKKVDAGAEFLVTQLFFDATMYFDFVERARAAGINVPIVPGVMPVTDRAQLARFTTMCGASIPVELGRMLETCMDDRDAVIDAGIEWATRQCRALLDGGAPGVHFYTLNQSRSAQAVCRNLRAY